MKPPCPALLRKGAVVRVETGWPHCEKAEALASIDLRFDDGHVERWLGPGSVVEPGMEMPQTVEALVEWGEEVIETQLDCLVEELAMDFSGVSMKRAAALAVEIVIEWNHEIDWPSEADSDRDSLDWMHQRAGSASGVVFAYDEVNDKGEIRRVIDGEH